MRKSHICLGCGGNLRQERAAPEPHYGLPMVTCPRCATRAVRRRHPIITRFRAVRRVGASISTMVLQIALVILFTVLIAVGCSEIRLGHEVRSVLQGEPEAFAFVFATMVALPIAVGTWLTAGLGHWRRWAAWIAFFSIPLFFMSLNVTLRAVDSPMIDAARAVDLLWDGASVLLVMMVVATLGIPLGHVCRAAHAGAVRWLWRSTRRRIRQRSLQ